MNSTEEIAIAFCSHILKQKNARKIVPDGHFLEIDNGQSFYYGDLNAVMKGARQYCESVGRFLSIYLLPHSKTYEVRILASGGHEPCAENDDLCNAIMVACLKDTRRFDTQPSIIRNDQEACGHAGAS
jgi:hypothetical protein